MSGHEGRCHGSAADSSCQGSTHGTRLRPSPWRSEAAPPGQLPCSSCGSYACSAVLFNGTLVERWLDAPPLFTVAVLDVRGHGSDRRGRVDKVVHITGICSSSLSWAVHTEPILGNLLSCVPLSQTACTAGNRSRRFEYLHPEPTYHQEALRKLRAIRPDARAVTARIARESPRAELGAQVR